MNKLGNFLSGTKVLEETKSLINGEIKVVRSLGFGTYIQVGGLTQSGGVVKTVWKNTLNKVQRTGYKVKDCLILGLGAGTAAQLVRKFWLEAKITGVEIDPVFIDLGKRYFGLNEVGVEIVNQDASVFIKKALREKRRYDLVLVDMYVGDEVPKKFETKSFIQRTRILLARRGIAVFNRLYYGEKRTEARKFGELLEKHFTQVMYHYPEANLMFICIKDR